VAVWCAIGLVVGVLYFFYEIWQRLRGGDRVPSLRTVFDGLFGWPIMLPEVIEYTFFDIIGRRRKRNTPAIKGIREDDL
jgi:hypothetical protein